MPPASPVHSTVLPQNALLGLHIDEVHAMRSFGAVIPKNKRVRGTVQGKGLLLTIGAARRAFLDAALILSIAGETQRWLQSASSAGRVAQCCGGRTSATPCASIQQLPA